MTREEYLSELAEIKKLRKQQSERICEMRREYLQSLEEGGMIGRKVRCFRKENYIGEAYLVGVDDDGRFVLNKVKKDGSMARVSAGYWGIDHIESI